MPLHCWEETRPQIFVLWDYLNLKLQQREGSLFGEVLLMLPGKVIVFPTFYPTQSRVTTVQWTFKDTSGYPQKHLKHLNQGLRLSVLPLLWSTQILPIGLVKCCSSILISGMSVPYPHLEREGPVIQASMPSWGGHTGSQQKCILSYSRAQKIYPLFTISVKTTPRHTQQTEE